MNPRWSERRVTDDPSLEAKLRERVDVLSSRQLAEYAHGLGLYPPGYADGADPSISLLWPPDVSDDDDGVLVWALDDD